METQRRRKNQDGHAKKKFMGKAINFHSFFSSYAECGGKMHLREGEFSRAHTDFFEAFKNYDESGSPRQVSQHRNLLVFGIIKFPLATDISASFFYRAVVIWLVKFPASHRCKRSIF